VVAVNLTTCCVVACDNITRPDDAYDGLPICRPHIWRLRDGNALRLDGHWQIRLAWNLTRSERRLRYAPVGMGHPALTRRQAA